MHPLPPCASMACSGTALLYQLKSLFNASEINNHILMHPIVVFMNENWNQIPYLIPILRQ
jgi:hypothetical protein